MGEEYEWIIAYGACNPEIVTNPDICMGKEMELCQEMVRMLPSKLSRIANTVRVRVNEVRCIWNYMNCMVLPILLNLVDNTVIVSQIVMLVDADFYCSSL